MKKVDKRQGEKGPMTKIIEPVTENDNDEKIVKMFADVSFGLTFYGSREDSEYKRIAIEHFRTMAGDISEHISYLANLENYTEALPSFRIFEILGDFGKGLMEGIEFIERDFETNRVEFWPPRNEQAEALPAGADLSNYKKALELFRSLASDKREAFLEHGPTLSSLILAVMNHPDLPARFSNTIHNAIQLMSGDDLSIPFNETDIRQALLDERCRSLEETRNNARSSESSASVDIDSPRSLAEGIAVVMNHRLTPEKLYNAIVDELGELCGPVMDEFIKSPDVIEKSIVARNTVVDKSNHSAKPISLSSRRRNNAKPIGRKAA